MLIYFSATYDRINKTWFGAWAWDESTYGPRETRTTQKLLGTEVTENKAGTYIMHGRRVKIWTDGEIFDGFFKDGKQHGPHLSIYPDGKYRIAQWENEVRVSS